MRIILFIPFILWVYFCAVANTAVAQSEWEKPKEDFSTPYNSLSYYVYYMSPEHYQQQKFIRLYPKGTSNTSELSLQLKQIFDGRGLRLQLSEIPSDSFFTDSISKKKSYAPFPRDLSEIYLELDKETQRWRFSTETTKAIPRLHKKIYPLGTDLLLKILPSFADDTILGLHVWQYLGIFIIGFLSVLLIWLISKLFRWVILWAAENKFGKGLFDKDIVLKLARINSYLLVFYLLYILIPALQLPIELNVYVIITLRICTTVFIVRLFSNSVELFKRYYLKLKEKELNNLLLSDNLAPIVSRSIKVIIYFVGFFHILSILDINVTALVAGLSIGGLALALAAQETVKNLIGSAMIFADKPFKIGDYVMNGSDIEGTVEDIGFRSTRIRNMDTSMVSVPNGKLIDMVITNLGERQMRRFHSYINVSFDTNTEILKIFIAYIEKIITAHPHTYKNEIYVALNKVEDYGLSIRMMVYFITEEWKYELQYRQEIIFGIIELAKELNITIIPPTKSIYINPNINNLTDINTAYQQANNFLNRFEQQYPTIIPDTNLEEPAFSPS